MRQNGTTILVTTHVMDEADRCQKLAMMREGQILTTGTPTEILSRYQVSTIEEAFMKLGSEVNLL